MTSPSMDKSDFELKGPNGELMHIEDVASLRAIHLNKNSNGSGMYFCDIVDMQGNLRKNYACSFKCLNFIAIMLFAESEKEDKTLVSVSFESLVNLLTSSRAMNISEDDLGASISQEAEEEFLNRSPTVLLN
jgi:hypothetical protein